MFVILGGYDDVSTPEVLWGRIKYDTMIVKDGRKRSQRI
jgi:hypothetical protein